MQSSCTRMRVGQMAGWGVVVKTTASAAAEEVRRPGAPTSSAPAALGPTGL